MNCPVCGHKSKMLESRTESKVRRRRRYECQDCLTRYTTYEIVSDHGLDDFIKSKIGAGILVEDPLKKSIERNDILNNIQTMFENQCRKGLSKYGKLVHPNSHTFTEWMEHLQQELIDATVYIESMKKKVENSESKQVV